jgi:glycosyltransferase involved in cell wall biosynthesis
MSCGLPVASTQCGGPETIIENEKLGFLSPVNDLNGLSNSLIKLSKATFDSLYIRNYAVDNYSFEALSIRLIEIYKNNIK